MKKFLLVSALAWVLVLTWCSQQKWLSQDELFEKKQECSNLRENMEKESNEKDETVIEIFYSQSENSCIYIVNSKTYHSIKDFFAKEYILTSPLYPPKTDDIEINKNWLNGDMEFYKTIKELKWE